MEAVVLAAVLGLSVVIAVASAFGALTLAMFLIEIASGASAPTASRQPSHAVADAWVTELALPERTAAPQRPLAA
jgi:hypothetical protein